MLSPAEWLLRAGFTEGNPFALKWADRECERLHEYFIEHHAYYEVIDVGAARSSILHAPRGAGKSSTRHMFEAYCQAHAEQLRPLVIQLTNWTPIVERVVARQVDQQAPLAVNQHDLLEEVLRLFVEALANLPGPWPEVPLPPDAAGYLAWMCDTHAHYLSPSQRAVFAERSWLAPPGLPRAVSSYTLEGQPVLRSFKIVAQVSAALGCRICYVVIDGVDELYETVADWNAGVSLLAPLIGNIQLLELPGLAFKCFVPTEIVKALRARGLLREDRIATIELSWTTLLLRDLLRSRLEVFSDGAVQSLAMVAAPDLADIDDQLCSAAGGSPRRLLNLGDRLLQACARGSDDANLLLRPAHLREALASEGLVSDLVSAPAVVALQPPVVPLLRLDPDGSVWRGDGQIAEARRLTPLQRELLSYLYQHRGRLCSTEELIDRVWKGRERPNDKDSLRRLADRLVELIEPDPKAPVYLKRPYGGFYVLQHTAGTSPQDPSKIPG